MFFIRHQPHFLWLTASKSLVFTKYEHGGLKTEPQIAKLVPIIATQAERNNASF